MSLIVWLPLNGSLENKGLSSAQYSGYNPAFVNGKFGKSLRLNKASSPTLNIQELVGCTEFSISSWIYVSDSDASASTSYNQFFRLGINVDGYESHARVEYTNNSTTPNNFQFILPRNTASGTFTTAYVGTSYTHNFKWCHCAITVDLNSARFYVNGKLHTTLQKSSYYENHFKLTGALILGTGGTLGNLNDIRIYDHCLSPEEIKEVSLGLICHFPLSNPYEEKYINLYKDYNNGNASAVNGFTKTKIVAVNGEVYYNFKCSHASSSTNNDWYYVMFPSYPFTAGKSYLISLKIRSNQCTNMSLTFRHARVGNDYYGCKTLTTISSATPTNIWNEHYLLQVIPAKIANTSGSDILCSPQLELYTGNLANLTCSLDFDIKDVMITESDHYLPFTNNNTDGIFYDASGYGNHGDTNGTPSPMWNQDSPMGYGSMKFNGNNRIKAPLPIVSLKNVTISMWVNNNGHPGGISHDTGFTIACATLTSNNRWQFANTANWFYIAGSAITNGNWYHCVCVITDSDIAVYTNGVKNTTASIGSNAILTDLGSSNFIELGADRPGGDEYYTGLISDFRLYTTALSDVDIKELYQKRYSIGTSGDLYCNELVENSTDIQLNKTGVLSASNFIEMDAMNCAQQKANKTEYIPNTGINSTLTAFSVIQEDFEIGDMATIELDVEWAGFDKSNTAGNFALSFQGECTPQTGVGQWVHNPYCTALNTTSGLTTLTLSKTAGSYHYTAKTVALTSANLAFKSMDIGLRSDYSNGTGKIILSNLKVYKNKFYLGKEKTRFTSDTIVSKDFIEC